MGQAGKGRLGWIEKYIKYTLRNEAPEIYHLWCGLTVLAHVLGRNIWLDHGYYRIYPGHLYTILVAGAGVTRKSTAVLIAVDVLHQVPSVKLIADKLSPQSLIDDLCRGMHVAADGQIIGPANSHGFISAPELSDFIPNARYMEELIPLLTNLYDPKEGPWKYKTRMHGEVVLHNPMATWLAATTPDLLSNAIPKIAFGGGFMSRIIWVFRESTDRRSAWPVLDASEVRLKQELVAELMLLGKLRGEVKLTPEAKTYWNRWYNTYMDHPYGPRIEGWSSRRPMHTLKVAMLVMISQRRSMTMQPEDIKAADAFLQQVEADMPLAFSYVGASALSLEQDRILDLLRQEGRLVSHRDLMRVMWRYLSGGDVRTAIQALAEAGLVEISVVGKSTFYRATK